MAAALVSALLVDWSDAIGGGLLVGSKYGPTLDWLRTAAVVLVFADESTQVNGGDALYDG